MPKRTDELAAPALCPSAVPAAGCQAELGWGLLTMARAFQQLAADAVQGLAGGLRGHLVLTSIAQGRAPSQAVLAAQLGLDRTVMTYLIDELEQAGYLERRPDPADRRARLLVITEAGTAALATYRARIDKAEARLLDGLSKDEVMRFRTTVEQVAQATRGITGGGPTGC